MHSERTILVGVLIKGEDKERCLESIQELDSLARTTQIEVIDKLIQVRQKIHPKFYIGLGKLDELKEDVQSKEIDTVIFDNDLSPFQVKNIESILECKVIGRTELILDIFANRARTKQAKLQVEYAQLSYLFPRLTRRWTHLSRIEGGIGLRGPGETQLEVDRRSITRRLHVIKKQLDKMTTQAGTRRKQREGTDIVCLVGYTNVGKSTLMNLLTKSKVLVDDALFATLDSTIRKAYISPVLTILLVDTVGFIKKLPHHLITSFKSTLHEVKSAKLLLHIVDSTDEDFQHQIDTVNQVLEELGADKKPKIYVFNKIDNMDHGHRVLQTNVFSQENSCSISAKTGEGIQHLKSLIEKTFSLDRRTNSL